MREKHRDSTSEWDKERQALKNMTTSRPSRKEKHDSPTRKS
jgi:hypothetical protein